MSTSRGLAGWAWALAAASLVGAACVPNAPATPTPAAAAGEPAGASPVVAPGPTQPVEPQPATPQLSPVAKPAVSPAAVGSPVAVASPSPVVERAVGSPARVAQPAAADGFGFGRPATPDDIRRVDIDVRADGQGLPPGSGTPAQGQQVFATKCVACHGANGEGTTAAPKLIDPTPYRAGQTAATVGNYWPYATTIFDYIRRAMPFNAPGSLSDE